VQCITPQELDRLFGSSGFAVRANLSLRRMTLDLKSELAAQQKRIGGHPALPLDRISNFTEALNRWLPTDGARLLWVDHWDDSFPSAYAVFMAARAGFGETRSLSEAPGHYFEKFPYHERDQLLISDRQARQTGILIGLLSLLMIEGWDGWLVASDVADRIEFWEGNVFFHSSDKMRLAMAKDLLHQFGCSEDLH